MKRFKFVLMMFVVLLLFAGCVTVAHSAASDFDPSKVLIGFMKEDKGHPVVRMWQASFLTAARNLGYSQAELFCGDSTDVAQTVSMAEQGIAKGVKGFVTVAEHTGYYPIIRRAGEQNIPVIMCHTIVKKEDVPGALAFVACDSFLTGANAAKAIGDKVGGKGTVAVVQGGRNTTENMTADGFIKTMKENYPDIKVLDPVEVTYDEGQAVARQVAVIQANPDLVAMFSTTGTGPQTLAAAARQTNKKDLVIIGMDYLEANLDLIKRGEVYAIMAQPIWEEVEYGVELLDKALRGDVIPFENLMPAPVVRIEDIDQYYGYFEKVRNAFR